jgi:hypothetical protein
MKTVEKDEIIEIGIDEKERLYLKPKSLKFPYIYREAAEVHWDDNGMFLYSPKPREWSYLDWFKQIVSVAKCQSCSLYITKNTRWLNIPENLKKQIMEHYKSEGT